MKGGEAAKFMGMLSRAKSFSPNHPRGGSTLFAEVDTERWGTRHLQIRTTVNSGVLIDIASKGLGRGGYWSAGTWRNDDLASVFGDYGAEVRRRRKSE
jgi:hypothetical protein